MKKKFLALGLCAAISLVSVYTGVNFNVTAPIEAAEMTDAQCELLTGNNIEAQNYMTWGRIINSYLCTTDDGGLMRVQYDSSSNSLTASYYTSDYQLKKYINIEVELPMFGGFYATDDAYYVVSGQADKEESDAVEVYRITKYDKEWNKIASDGLYGANTYEPFSAGSLRMTDDGKYLYIRTCHTMFMTSDGLHHQANVTIQLDMENMKITDSNTGISASSSGYISHSFNQFIKIENGKLLAVDHGDAYPRSICFLEYITDASSGKFNSNGRSCYAYDVLKFQGDAGVNYTGGSVGGFEVSDTHYLIAGNNTTEYGNNSAARNVFVASVSKETKDIVYKEITDYKVTEAGASTPHLVDMKNGSFLLMWSSENKIYYTKIDAAGNAVGEIMSIEGNLSDCMPVIRNGNVVWYTLGDEKLTFYEISCENPAKTNIIVGTTGHDYVNQGVEDGYQNQKCAKCGDTKKVAVITQMSTLWNTNGTWAGYGGSAPSEIELGTILYYWTIGKSSQENPDNQYVIEISDESAAVINFTYSDKTLGNIEFTKPGTYTFTIYPKLNPDLKNQVSVTVKGEAKPTETPTETPSEKPSETPSETPTASATVKPSETPTVTPSEKPTDVRGDFDGNGLVDLNDVLGILKVALGIEEAPEGVILDVDNNNQVDLGDVLLVLKAAVGIIEL